jgi:hypothetical protein
VASALFPIPEDLTSSNLGLGKSFLKFFIVFHGLAMQTHTNYGTTSAYGLLGHLHYSVAGTGVNPSKLMRQDLLVDGNIIVEEC